MPRVQVRHETEYRYDEPVRLGAHRLMLRPRDSHDLRLLETSLTVSPPARSTRWAHDVFGNSVCYLQFGDTLTNRLKVTSMLDLRHYPPQSGLPLDPSAEFFPFSYTSAEVPDLARSIERHYADPDRLVDAWAHRFLSNGGGPVGTMGMLTAMTQAVRSEFRYEGRQAEGTNDPLLTLATQAGACRDFTVFLMEAVRSLGLAARFASGYLYDERLATTAEQAVGGGATHAWMQVYLPGAGWVEFDPTNAWVAGRNLIRVSVARTPQQSVPISGSFFGPPGAFGGMAVAVEVTVG